MKIIKKIIGILKNPKTEFEKIKKEKFNDTLIYLLPLTIIFTVLQLLVGFPKTIERTITDNVLKYIIFFPASILILYLMIFLVTTALYFILKYFDHKDHFNDTFKAVAYGCTPYLILGWMPLIGIIASLYSAVLEIVGLKVLLKISQKRAIITYMIMVVMFIFFITLLIIGKVI